VKSTYQINEREDGALVASIDRPEWPVLPIQAGVIKQVNTQFIVILWDENGGSADFTTDDRAQALQVLDFHAALVARLVAAVRA
jgi:hypothetical protein